MLSGCTTGLAMKAMNGVGMCPPSVMQNAQQVDAVLRDVSEGTPVEALEGLTVERRMELTQRGGGMVNVLMYRTGHPRCRTMPTETEFTPVMVQNGVVLGVGDEVFNQYRRTSSHVEDVTPEEPEEEMTLGRLYKSLPF